MDAIPTDPDLWFVIGLVLAVLCIPSIFSAWTDNRTPRASAITVLIAGGMIAYAALTKPSGYRFNDIPTVVSEVLGRYIL